LPAVASGHHRGEHVPLQEIIRKLIRAQHRVRIGVVGKYIELNDAYKSVYERSPAGDHRMRCRDQNGGMRF